jgi:hypothetical protein
MDNASFTDLEHTIWILMCQTRDTMLRVRDNELSNRGLTAVEGWKIKGWLREQKVAKEKIPGSSV